MSASSGENSQTSRKQKETASLSPGEDFEQNMKKIEELNYKFTIKENEIAELKIEVENLRKENMISTAKVEQLIKEMETVVHHITRTQSPQIYSDFTVDDLNRLIDHRMHQIIQYDKPTLFTSIDISGRFKEIIKERFIWEVGTRIRNLKQSSMHTAMVVNEKKAVKRGELFSFLRGGGSRMTDDFYTEIRLLEETRLVFDDKETGIIHWMLGEYIKRELGSMYDETVIKQAEDYLASLLLPPN
jgi:molecular chaperone GrpE (heat shock protein)